MRRREPGALCVLALLLGGLLALAAPASASSTGPVYVVRPGDTLGAISARLGVSVEALVRANGISDRHRLVPGQVLRVPAALPSGSAARGVARTSAQAVPSRSPALVVAVHRVRWGETLVALARRYGVPVEWIVRANGLWSDRIIAGQRLAIPTRQGVEVLARRHGPPPRRISVPRAAWARAARPGTPAWDLIQNARRYVGVRYVWGGSTPAGLDCSGLVFRVFARYLPGTGRLTSFDYFRIGRAVPPEAILPGDLVFFTTDGPGPSHVGIFVGDGLFLHASSVAGEVVLTSLGDPPYRDRFLGVRRLVDLSARN
jgi:LysM repeat protein